MQLLSLCALYCIVSARFALGRRMKMYDTMFQRIPEAVCFSNFEPTVVEWFCKYALLYYLPSGCKMNSKGGSMRHKEAIFLS